MLTKSDLRQIDGALSKRVKKEMKPLKSDMQHVRKDIKTLINYFDREYLEIRSRVERIEEHLNLEAISP